jgi:uncharacterized protein YciU (UPF0263 family)
MSPESRTYRAWSLIASLLLVTAGLAGCVQEAEAASGEVYVKDDEIAEEADAVHVEYTKAEILPADSDEWVTVYEGRQEIELLNLSEADAREKLADVEIEPGEYDRLRIAVANVTVEHANGTSQNLVVHGNMVTVAEDITYEPGEDLELLLDFDLEESIDLENGEYTPVVGDLQRSDVDTDGNGVNDVNDTDDDGDGTPDHVDEDRNGDGEPDLPPQAQAYDKRGLEGVCTAWENNEQGRENGTVEANATAFQWLKNRSAEQDTTVTAYCEENTSPGAPDEIAITKDELPQKARQAIGDRHLGPPEDRRGHGDDQRPDEGADREERGEADRRDRNRTDADRNQTRSDEQEDRQQSEDEQRSDEQETNRSAEQQP